MFINKLIYIYIYIIRAVPKQITSYVTLDSDPHDNKLRH